MLRRQIENTEYIPLSEEFNNLIKNNHQILDETTENLDKIYFVIPDVKMQRGYYATEIKIITLGKIKDLKLSSTAPNGEDQSFIHPLLKKQARHQFKTYSSIHLLTGAVSIKN